MMPAATWPLSARDGLGAAIAVIATIAHVAITAGNLVMCIPLRPQTNSDPTSEIRPNGGDNSSEYFQLLKLILYHSNEAD
jgi:hypothetical protein